jgi:hypothetical protein
MVEEEKVKNKGYRLLQEHNSFFDSLILDDARAARLVSHVQYDIKAPLNKWEAGKLLTT